MITRGSLFLFGSIGVHLTPNTEYLPTQGGGGGGGGRNFLSVVVYAKHITKFVLLPVAVACEKSLGLLTNAPRGGNLTIDPVVLPMHIRWILLVGGRDSHFFISLMQNLFFQS